MDAEPEAQLPGQMGVCDAQVMRNGQHLEVCRGGAAGAAANARRRLRALQAVRICSVEHRHEARTLSVLLVPGGGGGGGRVLKARIRTIPDIPFIHAVEDACNLCANKKLALARKLADLSTFAHACHVSHVRCKRPRPASLFKDIWIGAVLVHKLL